MVCDMPFKAFRSMERDPSTGRYGVTFNPLNRLIEGSELLLPCGVCMGCRLDKARDWAVRCVHEAQMHEENCFITLTFSDDYLPWNYSVDVRDWQLFMKRLRKSLGSKPIRNFSCGEYGGETLRPHYHAIIFGHDFNDKVLFKKDRRGNRLYTSQQLSTLWPYGHSTLGNVTYQSAAYVAGYIQKKIGGQRAAAHYQRKHPFSGLTHQVKREFSTQSRRPGLGSTWFDKYAADCFPSDFVVIDGKKQPVPAFYLRKLQEEEAKQYKIKRRLAANKRREDNTPDRRAVRAQVRAARMSLSNNRNMEEHDQ